MIGDYAIGDLVMEFHGGEWTGGNGEVGRKGDLLLVSTSGIVRV